MDVVGSGALAPQAHLGDKVEGGLPGRLQFVVQASP